MNAIVKLWLTRLAKNAVAACVMTVGPLINDYKDHNWTTLHGLEGMAVIIGSAIAAREITFVVLPLLAKLAAWAQSNGETN